MRVGFFGGSFDPPHRGHMTVARATAESFHLGKVLLAPVAMQPLKPEGTEASYADRLQMVRLLCEGTERLEASSIDGPSADGRPNYTVDTLRRLRATLPGPAELFVIVGADAFRSLRQWRDSDGLLREAQWIVVSRPEVVVSWESLDLTSAQRERVHRLDGIAEPASATTVRERLRAGQDCADLLPPPVFAYIRAHHLYGA